MTNEMRKKIEAAIRLELTQKDSIDIHVDYILRQIEPLINKEIELQMHNQKVIDDIFYKSKL
jgi:hypothetical protein